MSRCSNWIRVVVVTSAVARAALAAASMDDESMPRVRTVDKKVAALIACGTKRSPTFKQLIERIDKTDGLVYIAVGVCPYHAAACLPHKMSQAGPNRVLHILINTQRQPQDVVASIAHELSHVMEVLAEPAIRDGGAIFSFYSRQGVRRGDEFEFETPEAIDTELKVRAELGRDFNNAVPRD